MEKWPGTEGCESRTPGGMKSDHLPHSGSLLQSGIGKELSTEKYAKRKVSDKESGKTAV